MATVTIRLAGDSLRTIARMKARPARLIDGMRPVAERAGVELASLISESEFGPGKAVGNVTGMLRRSIASRVLGVNAAALSIKVGVTKGPATAYASIHERGGTIKAKGGKALAIPVGKALVSGSRRPKFPGGPREAARKFPEMFMLKRPGKPPLLVRPIRVAGRANGKIARIEVLFVLKKSVKVSPKRYLSGGVQKHIGQVEVTLQDGLDRLMAE